MGRIMFRMYCFYARWPVFFLFRRRPKKQRSNIGPKNHREGGARTKKNRNSIIIKCVFYAGQSGCGSGFHKKGPAASFFEGVRHDVAVFKYR